jgi:hypothetical protein
MIFAFSPLVQAESFLGSEHSYQVFQLLASSTRHDCQERVPLDADLDRCASSTQTPMLVAMPTQAELSNATTGGVTSSKSDLEPKRARTAPASPVVTLTGRSRALTTTDIDRIEGQ